MKVVKPSWFLSDASRRNQQTGSQKSFAKETLKVLLAAGGDPPKDPVSLHLPRSGLNMSNDMSFKLQKPENAAKTPLNPL